MSSISVVIPSYNSAALLPRCIESILNQTVPVKEIFIIDDGSQDNTGLVARTFPAPVRLIQQTNAGAAVARNTGITASTGEWIAFLDADDRWLPEKLERQLECAAIHPSAELIYSDAAVMDEDNVKVGDYLSDKRPASGLVFDRLLHSFFILPSTVLARRSALLEVGMFKSSLREMEDYDLWLRLSRLCPFQLVPQCLTLYQRQPNSSSRNVQRLVKGEIELFRNLLKEGLRAEQQEVVRKRLALDLFHYAYELRDTDKRSSLRAIVESIRIEPGRLTSWKQLIARCASFAAPSAMR